MTISLNHSGALVNFDSLYAQEIEVVNEHNKDFDQIVNFWGWGLFTSKEDRTIPFNVVNGLEYSPVIELGDKENYDKALVYRARRVTADWKGAHYETKVATDGCTVYPLFPLRYRLPNRTARFQLVEGAAQARAFDSVLKAVDRLFKREIQKLKNEPIGGSPFKFGEISQVSENRHTVSYNLGDEVHFNFDWQISDLIRETVLGNEKRCDCRLTIKVRVRLTATGRYVGLSLLSVSLSDIGLENTSGNCPLLGVAKILAAIYNFINPTVLTPTLNVVYVDFKSPLVDSALHRLMANLPSSIGAEYGGNPRVNDVVINGTGTNVRIVYDAKSGSVTSRDPYNECWTSVPFNGEYGTHIADVTGDGRADAIALGVRGILVRRSSGGRFGTSLKWADLQYGGRGMFLADVDGTNGADFISVNDDRIRIRRSTTSGFDSVEEATGEPFYGVRKTLFADVTGDGMADAVAFNDSSVTIRRSIGNKFAPPEVWVNSAFTGSLGTFLADVNGDAKADAVIVNPDGIYVRLSTGDSFGIPGAPSEKWSAGQFLGTDRFLFADFNGDQRADFFIIQKPLPGQNKNAAIRLSSGASFEPQGLALNNSTGEGEVYAADLDGDRRAEPVIRHSNIIRVQRVFISNNRLRH